MSSLPSSPRQRALLAALLVLSTLGGLAALRLRARRDFHGVRHTQARRYVSSVPGRARHAPGGRFLMGREDGDADERPAHAVDVAPFSLDETEVTVAAYRRCVAAGACTAPHRDMSWEGARPEERARYAALCNWERPGHDEHPVNCVDWLQARAYCAFVGRRLPTEEEWEYAARGHDDRRYPWGSAARPGPTLLNGCDEECVRIAARYGERWQPLHRGSDGWSSTAPVGSYADGQGAFGHLDLAGNVWEWTESRYCPYSDKGCDSPHRVRRGGSWFTGSAWRMRTSVRFRAHPTDRSGEIGFRCAGAAP